MRREMHDPRHESFDISYGKKIRYNEYINIAIQEG